MKVFQEQYKHQIKQLADDMRDKTMPPLSEELFALFETTGNRLNYENVYFERRKFLAVFGIASYVFKQPADVEKLEEVLQEICREECWALPAHVNRRENPAWRLSVDLFAAETAQALAEIVTLVGEGANGADGSEKLPDSPRVFAPLQNLRLSAGFLSHLNRTDRAGNALTITGMRCVVGLSAVRLFIYWQEKRRNGWSNCCNASAIPWTFIWMASGRMVPAWRASVILPMG